MHIDLNEADLDLPVDLPIETRVKAGMLLLDEKHGPEWVWRIALDRLFLADYCQCVLGQLYGSPSEIGDSPYELGAEALGLALKDDRAAYGFTVASHDGWEELTEAWKTAIRARRLELVQGGSG